MHTCYRNFSGIGAGFAITGKSERFGYAYAFRRLLYRKQNTVFLIFYPYAGYRAGNRVAVNSKVHAPSAVRIDKQHRVAGYCSVINAVVGGKYNAALLRRRIRRVGCVRRIRRVGCVRLIRCAGRILSAAAYLIICGVKRNRGFASAGEIRVYDEIAVFAG